MEVVERSFPLLSCESWMFMKENPNIKKKDLIESETNNIADISPIGSLNYYFSFLFHNIFTRKKTTHLFEKTWGLCTCVFVRIHVLMSLCNSLVFKNNTNYERALIVHTCRSLKVFLKLSALNRSNFAILISCVLFVCIFNVVVKWPYGMLAVIFINLISNLSVYPEKFLMWNPNVSKMFLEIPLTKDQLTIATTISLKGMIKDYHTYSCHPEVKKERESLKSLKNNLKVCDHVGKDQKSLVLKHSVEKYHTDISPWNFQTLPVSCEFSHIYWKNT